MVMVKEAGSNILSTLYRHPPRRDPGQGSTGLHRLTTNIDVPIRCCLEVLAACLRTYASLLSH